MTKLGLVFERQITYYVLTVGLLLAVVSRLQTEPTAAGGIWGISTTAWFAWAIAFALAHVFLVWLCWRSELHYGQVTKLLGQRGFYWYSVGFVVLAGGRFVSLIGLAISNRSTATTSPMVLYILALVVAVLAALTFYSVAKYFGWRRALGADHFDLVHAQRPFVQRGMFYITPNAMYWFGIAIVWLPGLLLASKAALLAALFSHGHIWIHYLTTERPDMRRIYGRLPRHAWAARTTK